MSSNGEGFVKQYDKQMQKKVRKNISVADYFKEKANMMSFLVEGEDSCQTRTQGLYSKIELWLTRLLNVLLRQIKYIGQKLLNHVTIVLLLKADLGKNSKITQHLKDIWKKYEGQESKMIFCGLGTVYNLSDKNQGDLVLF